MSSHSPVPNRRTPTNARIQASLFVLTGLLLAPFAHAEQWSAYIGTGHVSASSNLPKQSASASATQAITNAPSLHWSARIGTGRVSSSESAQQQHTAASDVRREASSPSSAPHWSSKIGTGSAVDS